MNLSDLHVHRRFPFLARRIDTAAMVNVIAANKQSPFAHRLYDATVGSPMLASAFAQLFPFTFCAKRDCALPMAHDGRHLDLAGTVLS